MATPDTPKKKTFPFVPTAHWWALRKKFQQAIPGVVTANYIASVLDMQESSARANVLNGLKLTGLIDDDFKPKDRAKRWRDDEQYPKVCQEILGECYPQDLREAIPKPEQDRPAARRWFANHTGAGDAAVTKMVAFYSLLSEADASKATVDAKPAPSKPQPAPKERVRHAAPKPPAKPAAEDRHRNSLGSEGPSVHINLQVHISADASPEQIEKVFSSMAKHIYKGAE